MADAAVTGRPVSQRVDNLDILRGAIALSVVAIHAYSLGGRDAPIRAQHPYDAFWFLIAGAVWMFFAISGFGIAKPFIDRLLTGRPLPPTIPFAIRRVLRIYPLYWIVLTATIAVTHVHGVPVWALVLHYALLNNLAPRQQESILSPAWTLTIEIVFYICVPPLAAAVARARRRLTPEWLAGVVIASWALSVGCTVIADLQGDGPIGLWLRDFFPAMWQTFCPGILMVIVPYMTSERWRRWLVGFPARASGVMTMIVLVLAGTLLSAWAPLRYGIVPYQLVVDGTRVLFELAWLIGLAIALRVRPWSRHGRWLLDLGLASYGIYLIHPVLIDFMLRHGLAPVAHDTLGAFLANTAVVLALTIAVALASWRWFEHPLLEYGRRLGTRWQARHGLLVPAPKAEGDGARASDGDGARAFWNERAREDALYFVDTRRRYRDPDPDDLGDAEAIVELIVSELGLELTPADTVLEIGCGVGRLTRVLAVRAGRVIALDVSDEMLARARERHPGLANVAWTLGDGVSLAGIADASVDACLSTVVFQHIPDPKVTLGYIREVGRVLRDGGWAALQVSNDPAVHVPRDTLRHRLRARLGRGPRGQRHPAWLGSHVEIADVRAVADEAGLELERVWGEGTQYCQLLLRRRAGRG